MITVVHSFCTIRRTDAIRSHWEGEMPHWMPEFILVLRLSAAVPIVTFVPGYALSRWLFPKGTLDGLERGFVAVTTSIAISSLLGFGLLRIAGGLNTTAYLTLVAAASALFSFAAALRSRRALDGRLVAQAVGQRFSVKKHSPVIISVVVAVLGILVKIVSLPSNGSLLPLTEFYVSPQYLDSTLEIQPSDQAVVVPVEIVSHKRQSTAFRIVALENGTREIWDLDDITVPSGETWRRSVSISLSEPDQVSFLDLQLFLSDERTPVAQLRLWLSSSHDRVQALTKP
jgi:uncharacterized membrane protein